jgi:exodeoxyribonuclease VII large subunit
MRFDAPRSSPSCYTRPAVSGGPSDIIISVGELNRRMRRAVETASVGFWVRGEIASLKRAPSGHCYFTLKDRDEDACMECVMYKFEAQRALRHLADGAEVQLFGKATVWAPRGRLQFVAQKLQPAGRGALLLALEALKQKLAAEGLFDAARKRPLPNDPRVVGVVTSASGAAFHDIRTVAFRRGGVVLVLAPARVQGEDAPRSLVVALEQIERYPGLDVVIVGRGGGSGDDLMAFNDERVVRKIASLRVPVVSAVGHEIDISLSDLVADVRAATPSQAAELVVPDGRARRLSLMRTHSALARAMQSILLSERARLDRRRARLGDPRFVVAARAQELDELFARLRRRFERTSKRRDQATQKLVSRLFARHPRAVIAEQRARLAPMQHELDAAMRAQLSSSRAHLGRDAARLNALSPLAVLGRGYAIVLAEDGRAVRRASEARTGQALSVRLGEGSLGVVVKSTNDPEGS